jgi:hypothetical protein
MKNCSYYRQLRFETIYCIHKVLWNLRPTSYVTDGNGPAGTYWIQLKFWIDAHTCIHTYVHTYTNIRYVQYTRSSISHTAHLDSCITVQLDCIIKNTVSLWLYNSPLRSRHAVTCSSQSVSCLQTAEVQGCLFHKCNDCSLLNTAWHLVLT